MENVIKKQKLMSPDWSKMPTDMIEMIYKGLELQDQARFGSVCKGWYSCTYNKPYLAVPNSTPWLIDNNDESSRYNLVISPSHREKDFKINKPFRPFRESCIKGSIMGWLVIRSQVKVFILNLFSKVRIELPPRTTMPGFLKSKGYNVSGMDTLVSFTISTCVNSTPIMAAAVTCGGDLVWCKIGLDKAWKGYRGDKEYGNLTFHKDKLYAITRDGRKVDIFRVGVHDEESSVLFLLHSIDSKQSTKNLSDSNLNVYLVVSNGSVLVVKRYYHDYEFYAPTIGFDVFKVQENCFPPTVVNVDTLGDQDLFLGELNSESLPAKDFLGVQESCVYFTGYSDNSLISLLGAFSVKETRLLDSLYLTNMEYPIWVLPRFSFTCNCTCHDSTLWKPKKKKNYVKRKTNVV